MFRVAALFVSVVVAVLLSAPLAAQPLLKSAVNVDAGNTKPSGDTFTYRLTYNCSSTSGPCLGAEVVDLLPPEVDFVGTVPASPAGDVAAIEVTPNFGGSGRTRVRFDLIDPLPAGNSGDLLVNVRFPNGSTADGTVATNTADGIRLETVPGTFTTPPVDVTAVAVDRATVTKTLTSSPAHLDLPESYRLRVSVPSQSGTLDLVAVGPLTDTLPAGAVFDGATPAADCEPGCVGTTPATLTWTAPCSPPLGPGQRCDVTVNVTFPSATFTSGDDVTNSFVADAVPLGEAPVTLGPGQVTHPVTTFVPAPGVGLDKRVAGGSPNPPTLDQTFSYQLIPSNSGNVPLDDMTLIDTLPAEMVVDTVTSGAYGGLTGPVTVSYETNLSGGFLALGSSPAATDASFAIPALAAGEYVTRLRWELGQAAVGMAPTGGGARPRITGRIVSPDNLGNPVPFGTTVENCVDLTAVYTAGPTGVARNDCRSFAVSGPFVELNPAKDRTSGAGPYSPGQTVSWRLRVRSDARSSDPLPLDAVTVTDLLPVDLEYVPASWSFDDQGTGLPAPAFEAIPNFAATGRTLLRWTWGAASGDLAVGTEVRIVFDTTVRSGAAAGSLANDVTLEHDAPGLGQRCRGGSTADALDFDGDGDSAESLCRDGESTQVAPIAQLVSSKTLRGTCDGGFGGSSLGTLTGGALEYRLRVQNVGTVAMEDFVLVDVLPFVGDTGVRDTTPRGSAWTPLLAAPITPPPGTAVFYSTSGNPCRGEVGGPTTGCDPPGWTTVPPQPITEARAFKVEFGDRVVAPFDALEFTFLLTTPGDLPAGAEAFNSFAYQAERADGLGALAAEPLKVGIALGGCTAASLGDFVWADGDGDGLQDDGPTGLDGVFTELVDPGADGLPATADDVPLASVVTAAGPGGEPGWYRFPGLAPGDYAVCIAPPPTFVLSPADAGDDTLDADGSLAAAAPPRACSPVVALAADEDDPTVDFGLVPTRLAAVGDRVWFDRDGDGVQDESPFDGANGVTVRLFVDDGDGVAEPGGGDVPVAATATADDVYGRPGAYLFDRLIPGVAYFLQFEAPPVAAGFTTPDAGGDDAADSDAALPDGTTAVFTLAPDQVDRSYDAGLVLPSGPLSLGDQVWFDGDDDGLFEPEDGEVGIDGVRLDLYLDADGDGEPGLGEQVGTTVTATAGGFAGRYRFTGLAAGDYVVVVSPSAFLGGGPLFGLVSSSGNDPAPDPDDDANGDDNGTDVGTLVASRAVTLAAGAEPTAEDGDADSNLTVDFGFAGPAPVAVEYDYGDAPDVLAGTGAGDYGTTVLDGGASHRLGGAGAPYLGSCVDADGGFLQDVAASADDAASFGTVVGSCGAGGDEDGVAFTGPFVPGGTATFTVTAAAGVGDCALDAWVDWNGNGVFGDTAGEVVAAAVTVPAGAATVLTPAVPAGAVPGVTYARFRCSTAGGLPPTGTAADGEVEDYRLAVQGRDLGDAPASYGTQGGGAASHAVDPLAAFSLGACVDLESDGQPTAGADGDDAAPGLATVGNCFDDEDGVVFAAPLAACQSAPLTVTASAAGVLDAWVDFDADGDFSDAGERVFTGEALAAGANALTVTVPCAAAEGVTYARFRYSATGVATADGPAADGEVEDYRLDVGAVDFGDAPDSYATLLASGGPTHRRVAGFSLGAAVDTEVEGQPSAAADGDGADEDGVTFAAPLVACRSAAVTVELTNTAAVVTPLLDAWIDFDGDGAFDDPRDRIATALPLSAGANPVPFGVPCDAAPALTFGRFRLSSAGVAAPGGGAADGEVEDHGVTLLGVDYGDAPEPAYPTLLASDGARHLVAPLGNPLLGARVDTEADGQPDAAVAGDDAGGGPDDEDGASFPEVLIPGATGRVQLVTGPVGGAVSCWIDFDRDGDWSDAGEAVVSDAVLAAGTTAQRTFPVPVGSPQGSAVTRCRISSVAGLGVRGEAPDGEVEDLPAPVGVEDPRLGVAKRLLGVEADPDDPLRFVLTFELRLQNLGNVPLSDVNVSADFAAVFAAPLDFQVLAVPSGDFAVAALFDGRDHTDVLAAGNTLGVGAVGTVQVVLQVDSAGEAGPFDCSALGRGTSPADVPVTDVSQDGGEADADGDGDAGDDSVPTRVVLPLSVLAIPALGPVGLLLLAVLLAWAALRRTGGGRPVRNG